MRNSNRFTTNIYNLNKEDLSNLGILTHYFYLLTKSFLPIAPVFVIRHNAFEHFLVENSLNEIINQTLTDLKNKKVDKFNASKKIRNLILQAEIPLVINKEIIETYKTISGLNEAIIKIIPTHADYKLNNLLQNYKTNNISGTKELLEQVKQSWGNFYNEDTIETITPLNISTNLLVQKQINAESSGRAYNHSTVDDNPKIIEIEAIYGIDEENITTPDIYRLTKKNIELIEKVLVNQPRIAVRIKDKKTNYLREIKISNQWFNKQKIDNSTIDSIARATMLIENDLKFKKFNFEWSKESEKILITNFNEEGNDFLSGVRTITSNDEEVINLGTRFDSEIKYSRSYFDVPQEAQGLKLIMSGTGNESGTAWGAVKVLHNLNQLSELKSKIILVIPDGIKITNVDIEPLDISGIVFESEASVSKIPTISYVHKASTSLREGELISLDSNTGDIFVGLTHNGAEPKTKQKSSSKILLPKTTETKTIIETFISVPPQLVLEDNQVNIDGAYLDNINEVTEIAKKLNTKPLILNISFNDADKILSKFNLIHKLRNQENLRNLWISLSDIKRAEDFVELKKFFLTSKLRRSSTFKVFINLNNPASVMSLGEITNAGVDAVMLDLDTLVQQLFGSDEPQFYFEKATDFILDTVINHCHSHNIKIYIKSKFIEDVFNRIIKLGVTGMICEPLMLNDVKKYIAANELTKLKPKPKRGRRPKKL